MKAYRYVSENMEFNATHTGDTITFKVEKKTIPLGVNNKSDLAKLIANYLIFFPDVQNFNDGHIDSFFCNVCQMLSDAKCPPMVNGELGFPRYGLSKNFKSTFYLILKTTGEINIDKIEMEKFEKI